MIAPAALRTDPVRRHRLRALGAGLLVFLLAAAFPGASACLFRSLSGLPCPACGGTRAVLALLHGDPGGSFFWNPGLWAGALVWGGGRLLGTGPRRAAGLALLSLAATALLRIILIKVFPALPFARPF